MRKKRCYKVDKYLMPVCAREFWTRKIGPVFCWKHRREVVKGKVE